MIDRTSMYAIGAMLRSTALRTAAVYGAGGIGFAGANLLLARTLSYTEYAVFALAVAFLYIGIPISPLGADTIVNRHQIPPGARLLRQTLGTSAVVAASAVVAGYLLYSLPIGLLLLVAVATIAGGATYLAAAHYQSRRQFRPALTLTQGANALMLVAAIITVIFEVTDAWPTMAVLAVGYVVFAVIAWSALLRDPDREPGADGPFPWREAMSLVGMSATWLVLVQLERFLIPKLLDLHALATFGVLAATAGSFFRVLQLGVGYSLLPRLRLAPDVAARRRLVRGEAIVVGAVVTAGSAAVWVLVPLVVRWFLAGKYELPPALVAASIVVGVVKIGSSFGRTVVTALGDARDLRYFNLLGWLSVGVAVIGAVIGARWGLAALLYGIGAGWLVQTVAATVLGARHLRPHGSGMSAPAAEPEPSGQMAVRPVPTNRVA